MAGFAPKKNKTKLKTDDILSEFKFDADLPATVACGSSVSSGVAPGHHTRAGQKNTMAFWALVILSLILGLIPQISWLFHPITQFTTMVHEMSHAVACMITGGTVTGMTIVSDGLGHGGITNSAGGNGFLIAQAGYLGTTLFGCLLIYLGQFPKASRFLLGALGSTICLASVVFMGQAIFISGMQAVLSMAWGLAMGGTFIWLAKKLKSAQANLVVLFLAIQTAMSSLTSIQTVVLASLNFDNATKVWSDASILQNMSGIPAVLWSLSWVVLSLGMLGCTIWWTYGGKRMEAFASKK